ncbi:hypothetical protein WA588_005407 [Blastocystis sp. NMH]
MPERGEGHFACSQCNHSFADNAHLRSHQLSHSKAKPFVCDTCPKRYARMSTLREHHVVHDQSNDCFICPLQSCGKHLQSFSGFINHERRHFANDELNWNINQAVRVILKSFIKRNPITLECNRVYCHSIRTHWKRNLQIIRELNATIAHLEEELEELDDEPAPVVIPASYLSDPNPYICGVKGCRQRFPSYEALTAHASHHPDATLLTVLGNQLFIPEGRYHCPFPECEFGDGKRSLPLAALREHFQTTHLYHARQLVGQTVSLPAFSLPALQGDRCIDHGVASNGFSSDGLVRARVGDRELNERFPRNAASFTYYPADVYNNGNVILDSCGETQRIRWLWRGGVFT